MAKRLGAAVSATGVPVLVHTMAPQSATAMMLEQCGVPVFDRIESAMVVEWVSQHVSPRAEAVVIGGNGFRAAGAIHELEDATGRLVLEANQVLLWSVLIGAGVSLDIRGFGALFDALE